MKKFQMDSKKKKIWLKALRSGKYKQGHLELKSDYESRYCCLGVACAKKLTKPFGGQSIYIEGAVSYGFLPKDVQDKLIDMNDNKKYSFKQIANWIEKNL